MTTLDIMKNRISDEISRADLTSQIANAINDAIAMYQTRRFYFNETGPTGSTFNTIANQETYTETDDPDIPYMYDVDDVFVTVGVNNYRVKRIDPTLYRINQMPNFKGQPYQYMFLNQTFSFSPIPNTVYPMQIVGHYKLAAPASDSEANNHWMTDAERLIRSCAKRFLYQDILLDADAATACQAAEIEAFDVLKGASAGMIRNGMIQPQAF